MILVGEMLLFMGIQRAALPHSTFFIMNKDIKEFVELLNSGIDSEETDRKALSLLDSFYEEFTMLARNNGRVHPDINEIIKLATPEVLTAMFMSVCVATITVCNKNES